MDSANKRDRELEELRRLAVKLIDLQQSGKLPLLDTGGISVFEFFGVGTPLGDLLIFGGANAPDELVN
jgi:hypothetical protein